MRRRMVDRERIQKSHVECGDWLTSPVVYPPEISPPVPRNRELRTALRSRRTNQSNLLAGRLHSSRGHTFETPIRFKKASAITRGITAS